MMVIQTVLSPEPTPYMGMTLAVPWDLSAMLICLPCFLVLAMLLFGMFPLGANSSEIQMTCSGSSHLSVSATRCSVLAEVTVELTTKTDPNKIPEMMTSQFEQKRWQNDLECAENSNALNTNGSF